MCWLGRHLMKTPTPQKQVLGHEHVGDNEFVASTTMMHEVQAVAVVVAAQDGDGDDGDGGILQLLLLSSKSPTFAKTKDPPVIHTILAEPRPDKIRQSRDCLPRQTHNLAGSGDCTFVRTSHTLEHRLGYVGVYHVQTQCVECETSVRINIQQLKSNQLIGFPVGI